MYGYGTPELRQAWGLPDDVPIAHFFGHAVEPERTDVVSFDDIAGGRMATQHLLDLGHRTIAYLGLHTADFDSKWSWSQERMNGWSEVLQAAGLPTEGLAYIAERVPTFNDQECVAAGAEIAERGLAARRDVTAVVACNDVAALGLIEALNRAGVPKDEWPAIVGFDDLPLAGGRLLTSLRLPYDDVGRAAARLLWQRRHGLLFGPPVHERVPMKLLPRLSSKAGWSAKFDFTPILLASRA
jgi:DNA-binding LacI/PurR family transcriptional regulator